MRSFSTYNMVGGQIGRSAMHVLAAAGGLYDVTTWNDAGDLADADFMLKIERFNT